MRDVQLPLLLLINDLVLQPVSIRVEVVKLTTPVPPEMVHGRLNSKSLPSVEATLMAVDCAGRLNVHCHGLADPDRLPDVVLKV